MAILRKITHPEQKSSLIRRQTRSDFKTILDLVVSHPKEELLKVTARFSKVSCFWDTLMSISDNSLLNLGWMVVGWTLTLQ